MHPNALKYYLQVYETECPTVGQSESRGQWTFQFFWTWCYGPIKEVILCNGAFVTFIMATDGLLKSHKMTWLISINFLWFVTISVRLRVHTSYIGTNADGRPLHCLYSFLIEKKRRKFDSCWRHNFFSVGLRI